MKQGKRIGKVAKGAVRGAIASTWRSTSRKRGLPTIRRRGGKGCRSPETGSSPAATYPDDKQTANQYRGVLVPCKPEDEVSASS